jgi:catechol 2,3-dioxygenase-like lactoylglutathione lyase family enzyme
VIDHLGVVVSAWARNVAFYEAALAPLGAGLVMQVPPEITGDGSRHAGFGRDGKPSFWIAARADGTVTREGLHVAFAATSRAAVDAFHAAAIAAGGRDNGAPGLRLHYHPDYYGAFVTDPDGHNIEAVCHRPETTP